jgi:hypothetical protein
MGKRHGRIWSKDRELHDPVLSFELDNGFKFVKILPNYLEDIRSKNYASFIEWVDPEHRVSS